MNTNYALTTTLPCSPIPSTQETKCSKYARITLFAMSIIALSGGVVSIKESENLKASKLMASIFFSSGVLLTLFSLLFKIHKKERVEESPAEIELKEIQVQSPASAGKKASESTLSSGFQDHSVNNLLRVSDFWHPPGYMNSFTDIQKLDTGMNFWLSSHQDTLQLGPCVGASAYQRAFQSDLGAIVVLPAPNISEAKWVDLCDQEIVLAQDLKTLGLLTSEPRWLALRTDKSQNKGYDIYQCEDYIQAENKNRYVIHNTNGARMPFWMRVSVLEPTDNSESLEAWEPILYPLFLDLQALFTHEFSSIEFNLLDHENIHTICLKGEKGTTVRYYHRGLSHFGDSKREALQIDYKGLIESAVEQPLFMQLDYETQKHNHVLSPAYEKIKKEMINKYFSFEYLV